MTTNPPTQTIKSEKRYCTYSVFDPTIQQFIYVGMTDNLERRIKQHKRASRWWKDDLQVATINADLEEQEARKREKYWIRYYGERGHPLKNSHGNPNTDFDRMVIMSAWLEGDTETIEEEKEEILLLFLNGRNFLSARDRDDMEWQFTPTWDRIH